MRTFVRLEGSESTQVTNLIRALRALGLLTNLDALVPGGRRAPSSRSNRSAAIANAPHLISLGRRR